MSRKRLWDFYGDEPFMENPHLAIVGNPFKVGSIIERKRSGFRKISQKKGKTIMAYKKRRGRKHNPRRKSHRRNPFPTAGIAVNPRHHRKHKVYHMRKNPHGVYVHHRKRHHRRNPAVLGVALPPLNMIAWGAGGFIAPPMVEGFINQFLPVSVTASVLGRYAVKIGSVLGLTWLTKTVLSNKEAFPVALGGSLYVVVSAVNEFVPQLIPHPATTPVTTGTAAYRSGMIKAYRGGMIGTGVGQYSRPGLAQRALPGLAESPRWDLGPSGMPNPTQADPRFSAWIPTS